MITSESRVSLLEYDMLIVLMLVGLMSHVCILGRVAPSPLCPFSSQVTCPRREAPIHVMAEGRKTTDWLLNPAVLKIKLFKDLIWDTALAV